MGSGVRGWGETEHASIESESSLHPFGIRSAMLRGQTVESLLPDLQCQFRSMELPSVSTAEMRMLSAGASLRRI
eukprot:4463675-Pleurochrysis_carterae.AAC.1